ncbi:hypothetical protein B296_00017857, partial [Ensete ventricosum]
SSNIQLRENLDLLEEKRAEAHLRELTYRKAVARLYNLRGKLAPNWEGPYRAIKVVRQVTCILTTMDGKQLSSSWHISNLRKFYA